ncbi:MAG: response regulator transcription factor [Saprospiraceae bacterium]|nr:response regulator transcription factor [Saprospiraceae bacterium]
MRINALIVEDHALFAEGLVALLQQSDELNIKVLDVSKDGCDAVTLCKKRRVDLIFLDLNLGRVNGLDLIKPIKEASPKTKILVVSGYDNQKFVKKAFLNGADGYLLKGSKREELVEAIETVMSNNTFMGQGVQVSALLNDTNEGSGKGSGHQYLDAYSVRQRLTKREHEILRLITQAYSNKQIGEQLFISDQTVSVHRKNIMRKLGVTNTVSLVKAAQSLSISE